MSMCMQRKRTLSHRRQRQVMRRPQAASSCQPVIRGQHGARCKRALWLDKVRQGSTTSSTPHERCRYHSVLPHPHPHDAVPSSMFVRDNAMTVRMRVTLLCLCRTTVPLALFHLYSWQQWQGP
jgi:hypothetical protein